MHDIQVSHHISSRMRKSNSKPTTTFPWSQACKQPNSKPKFWTIGSRHKLTTNNVWKHNYQNGFNHSRKDRQTYLRLTWPYRLEQFLLPRILQQNLVRSELEESTIDSRVFPKTPNCFACRRTKVTRAPCRRPPDDRSDRLDSAE